MARMIPSMPFSDAPPGEKDVFNRLRTLPDTWTVLHSLVFSLDHGRDAEADFLVLDPSGNTLVVEVKSHRSVEFTNGKWLGNGKEIKDPFRQAREASYRVMQVLRQMGSPLARLTHARVAIFPFADFRGQSPEFHRFEYLNGPEWLGASADGVTLEGTFLKVISATRSALGHQHAEKATSADLEVALGRLRPSLRSSSRALDLQLRSGEITRAFEDQCAALEAIEGNERLLIDGPAGSGKTLLAMRMFLDRKRLGERVLLLTFNRAISKSLQKWAEAGMPGAGASVLTLHALAHRICRHQLAQTDDEIDLGALLQDANDFLLECACPIGPIDCIIVDEAQDIIAMPGALDLLEQVLGTALRRARWAMFGDFSNQVLYTSRERVKASFEELLACSATHVKLRHNCRNNRQLLKPLTVSSIDIMEVYRGFRRTDDSADQYSTYPYADDAGFSRQIQLALAFVRRQLASNGRIAVLLGHPPNDNQARTLLQAGIAEFERPDALGPVWTTIRKAKGLEFDAVILANVSDGSDAPELLYTGSTRALLCVAWLADIRKEANS